jgi:two-component system, NtrC family, response regulator AtoC
MDTETPAYSFSDIIAQSNVMLSIFKTITKIADYKTTVLITGESGTGKELIAKAIHQNSSRRALPMVDVNCGGIPETLLESELFGHAKGAFTDAYKVRKGLFEEADNGTLFLDEMGELPLALQVKLLRAVQEEEIRPLGDSKSVKIDVRIVAATARNLADMVNKRLFREDLFYRINVLTIEVPPLRERREDISLLVEFFIKNFNKRLNLEITGANEECMNRLIHHSWPGNVRELENVIERSMVLAEGNELTTEFLPPELADRKGSQAEELLFWDTLSIKTNGKKLEKQLIIKALIKTKGNKTRASSLLEISLPALLYKIKEYGVNYNELL